MAVDPREIALGTVFTIRLADGTEIDAIALDVGGDIKGARIDVLMANLHDAKQFGRQAVSIKIEEESK
ncbi:3D domain-containing protein (plasmid) [Paenibacillus sp. JNUCC32]|uniref:3D domain-containing protein n=1 Tax=Paenibacillus sp. JNUCC32 TaxID=2777984 RepID=UPI001787A0F9|nr:3D domain-containing protein [Paenibacillus sp. JNUCC-32]QOT13709.1 3D domain-containing protein [Paenibacillus sp. JNUCC-32]